MSEEEKEAVKILEDEDNIIVKIGYNDYGVEHIRKIYDDGEKERILNLIDKQQKVIDLMAEYLNENNREFWADDIEEAKQYFYKKAEEEK